MISEIAFYSKSVFDQYYVSNPLQQCKLGPNPQQDDHFKNLDDAEAATKAMDKFRSSLQALPLVPIVQSSNVMVQYLKCRFVKAGVFSVPKYLLDLAKGPSDFNPAHLPAMHLIECMTFNATVAQVTTNLVLFQVIDPFPERKYQVRSIHVQQKRSEIRVSVLNVFAQHVAGVSADGAGHHVDLDLLQWCGERFQMLMQSLCSWSVEPGALSVSLQPRCRPLSLPATMACLPNMHDADSLAVALPDDLPLVELSSAHVRRFSFQNWHMGIVPAPDLTAANIVSHSSITQAGLLTIKALIDRKAFVESDVFVEYASLPDNACAAVDSLIDIGVMCARMSSFQCREVALHLSAVTIGSAMYVSRPVLLTLALPRVVALKDFSKLELVQYLVMRKFKPLDNPDVALLRTHTRDQWVFWADGLYKARSYFMALCYSPIIFSKQGQLNGILHKGPNSYYRALLALSDLTQLARLSYDELLRMSDANFSVMLKDKDDPTHYPAVIDGAEEDALALENAGDEINPLPSLPHPPAMIGPGAMSEKSIVCKVPGFRPMNVCLDNFTHSSGRRRAFIHCSLHKPRCRLYVFLDDFPTKQRCVSYLMAWNHIGLRWGLPNQSRANERDGLAYFVELFPKIQYPKKQKISTIMYLVSLYIFACSDSSCNGH